MRLIPLVLVALVVTAPAPAQDWKTLTVVEDGFRSNYPGDPTVESISYETEFHLRLLLTSRAPERVRNHRCDAI